MFLPQIFKNLAQISALTRNDINFLQINPGCQEIFTRRRGGGRRGGGVISDLMRDPERTQSIRLFMVSLSLVTGRGGARSNFRGFNKVFKVNLLKHS